LEILEQSSVTDVQAGNKPKAAYSKGSDCLKDLRNKLIPILTLNNNGEFDSVEQKGVRLFNNLYLKFGELDDSPDVVYQLRENKRKKVKSKFFVGKIITVCKFDGNSPETSIDAANKNSKVDEALVLLEDTKTELSAKMEGLSIYSKPTDKNFYKKSGDDVQVQLFFEIKYEKMDELITDDFVSNVSEMTMTILKAHKLINQ
jgi:hypothetical protein